MPVNHEGLVDYILSEAAQDNARPDPVEVMQVAAQGLKSTGYAPTADDMGRISAIARRKLGLDSQQGAASAGLESMYRSGVVSPLGGIDARILGNSPDIVQANQREQQILQQQHPVASFTGDVAGSVVAPIVGGAAGGVAGTAVSPGLGTAIGAIGGGLAAGIPYTLGGDVEREQMGRGTGNRIANAALETGVNAIPGGRIATRVLGKAGESVAGRVGGNLVEGGVMGGGQNTGAQTIDVATGDREHFSATDAMLGAAGGAAGGAAAHGAISAVGAMTAKPQPRVVNMDAPQPAVIDPALANAQREADASIRMSQAEGVGVPQEQRVREKLLAQRQAADLAAQQKAAEPLPGEDFLPPETVAKSPEQAVVEPAKPTATDLAEQGDLSGYETNTDRQDAQAFDRSADTAPVVEGTPVEPTPIKKGVPNEKAQQTRAEARVPAQEAGKAEPVASLLKTEDHLSPAARAFVDKQTPETKAALQESLDHLKQHPDPQGDLGNLQMVAQGVERRAAKKAAAEPAPKREFFKNDLGKLTEVSDRIDPKHYAGQKLKAYEDLSPVQQKSVDATVARTKGTNKSRSGAALNPAAAIVDAAKASGAYTKDKLEMLGHGYRALGELAGVDSIDRLHQSPHKGVRSVGEKLSEAVHHGKAAASEMHHEATQALRDVASTTRKSAKELRKADEPAPANGQATHADSLLYQALEGRAAVPAHLAKIKDAFTSVNKVTADKLRAAGVQFHDNGKGGKDVVVRHFTDDAKAVFQHARKTNTAFKNFVDAVVELNTKKNGSKYTPDEVREYFSHTTAEGLSASVRLDPLEVGRKFQRIPQYVKGDGGEWVRLIETDPTRYVHATVGSATRRIGMAKALGAGTNMADLLAKHTDIPARESEALTRALSAYNGVTEGGTLADFRTASRAIGNVKQVYSALRTSAAAAMDATEPIALLGQVPMQHVVRGVVNSALKSGRAVHEGGIEADIKNLSDLHSKGREVAGNTRGFLQRLFLRNAVNRGSHIMAYESGRSWGEAMRNGTVSATDEVFMNMNRIPKEVQSRFVDHKATESDSIVLGAAVAQNMSGRKTNLAEAGRLSRNETVNALGPLFRQFAENRIRNLVRTEGAIRGAVAKGEYVAAGRLFVERLTGVTASATAATAVGILMKYAVEGLKMSAESGDFVPSFLGNVVGGGLPSSVIQGIDQPDAVQRTVQSLFWPWDAAKAAFQAATDPSKALDLAPGARRIKDAVSKEDMAGREAYKVFKSNESKLFGSFTGVPGEATVKSQARSTIRKALLDGDFQTAAKEVNRLRPTMSTAEMNTFIRQTMLLSKYDGPKDRAKLNQLRDSMGPTAYARIRAYDATLKRYMREP